jgi:hypothetical protein
MYEDQSGGLELERSFDDLASVDRRMIDGAALLALMSDQHVFAVEKEDVKFLDFAVSDLRVAAIDQLVPGIDDRPPFQFRSQHPQPRLARRFERGNPGRTQPGNGERASGLTPTLGIHD